MATLAEIRTALADRLRPLMEGELGWQVSAYALANPTLPYAFVIPADNAVEYHKAMRRGLVEWTLEVHAWTPLVDDVASQLVVDELMAPSGPRSVAALIETVDDGETNPTLGGVVEDVTVVNCSGYRQILRDGGGSVLEVVWTVQVLAEGDA